MLYPIIKCECGNRKVADPRSRPLEQILQQKWCDKFLATTNQTNYEKHVVLNHNSKPCYPSLADLKKNNLKSQGKSWEIK
jgi:hypothetical protein